MDNIYKLSEISDTSLSNQTSCSRNQSNITSNTRDTKRHMENITKTENPEDIFLSRNFDIDNDRVIKLNFIYNCLKNITRNTKESFFNSDTCKKLQRIFLKHEALQFQNSLFIDKNLNEETTFLGVSEEMKCELNDVEKLEIKGILESKLREETHDFICGYDILKGTTERKSNNKENIENKLGNELEVLDWTKKINEIYMKYEENSRLICQKLKILNEYKEKLSEAHFKNAEYISLEAQVIEVQTTISKLSCILRLFLETPLSIDAFRCLNHKLDTKINQVESEIQKKANLMKEYDELKYTEYDEILKKYIKVCDAIKKKEMLLERL